MKIIKRISQVSFGIICCLLGSFSIFSSIMCSFLDTSEIDHPFGSAYVKAKLFAVSEMFMAFGVVAVLLGLRTMLNKKEWFVNLINQKWKRTLKYAMLMPWIGFLAAAIVRLIR